MTALKHAARRTETRTKTKRLKAERLSMRIDTFAKAKLERAAAY